jgi:hypothetical protein
LIFFFFMITFINFFVLFEFFDSIWFIFLK